MMSPSTVTDLVDGSAGELFQKFRTSSEAWYPSLIHRSASGRASGARWCPSSHSQPAGQTARKASLDPCDDRLRKSTNGTPPSRQQPRCHVCQVDSKPAARRL